MLPQYHLSPLQVFTRSSNYCPLFYFLIFNPYYIVMIIQYESIITMEEIGSFMLQCKNRNIIYDNTK